MACSKKELEIRVINRAVDSIVEQLRARSEDRPDRIALYNAEPTTLENFQTVLSSRFPFDSYRPEVIIAEGTEGTYSIDVSFYLKNLRA